MVGRLENIKPVSCMISKLQSTSNFSFFRATTEAKKMGYREAIETLEMHAGTTQCGIIMKVCHVIMNMPTSQMFGPSFNLYIETDRRLVSELTDLQLPTSL